MEIDPFLDTLLNELKAATEEAGKLSDKEEMALLALPDKSPEVRNRIFLNNIGLVVDIAGKYLGRGLTFSELIHEGWFGMMTAIDNFDSGLGTKFSTYVYACVEGAIKRAVDNKGRTIRVPVHVLERFRFVWRAIAELELVLGRKASFEEIADELIEQGINIRPEQISEVLQATRFCVSLDGLVWEDDGDQDAYWKDGAVPVDEQIWEKIKAEEIAKLLGRLSAEQERVIRLYFGFSGEGDDGQGLFLREIAYRFGYSRQRAGQVYYQAMNRLCHLRNLRKSKALR